MTDLVASYRHFLPNTIRNLSWQAHPLDGKLLLFERAQGLNVLLEGDETAHLQRLAPRALLIAVTNACNLACQFCYRDLKSRSLWQYDSLLKFCQQANEWGVLEVAFGGGEPMLFPHWADFICELCATTNLCINFTTNGMLLADDFLHQIAGCYGQIRVSLYDDNDWPSTLSLLSRAKARFGVNWLITPDELDGLESKFVQLLKLGVHDFLFLSYKGPSHNFHLNESQRQRLTSFINYAYAWLGSSVQLKLDICWGDGLPEVPRLFAASDCEAGDDFLSITSDKRIKPCSFHSFGVPFETLGNVKTYWQKQRRAQAAAPLAGCARLPDPGLSMKGIHYVENIGLETI